MATRYHDHPPVGVPDLIDLSDTEELYSVSEEEPTQREVNDRLLSQAINYLAEEGGDDSAPTFVNRVNRLDQALVQQLPQAGRNFDPKLYRQVRAMVREEQRKFEEAAQANSATSESEDPPKYYMPSTVPALYREGDNVPHPQAAPLQPRSGRSEDNVQRERVFKYGGPSNEIENWYKDFPAILPFPETIQMAHWESLKIDFDLSETGKKLKAEGKVVETNISFNHASLQQYKDLDQYDSGSRFKLPKPTPTDEARIKRLGSEKRLKEAVLAFNKGNRDEEIKKDYAPRIVLETLSVGHQWSPTAIRRSVNVTPTKSRTSSVGSTVTAAPSAAGSAKRKMFEPTQNWESPEPLPTPPVRRPQTPLPQPRIPTSASRPTAAIRAFQHEVEAAIRESPRRQSSIIATTAQVPTPKSTTRIATHVAVPGKRGPGRPRKIPQATEQEPVHSPPSTKSSNKRKRSVGSATYTPDNKRKKSIGSEEFTPSSLKTTTRSSQKKVAFADATTLLESSDEEEVIVVSPTPIKTRKTTPASGEGKASKAAAAGKQVRKKRASKVTEETVTESDYEQRITSARKGTTSAGAERVGQRTTRSGTKFK